MPVELSLGVPASQVAQALEGSVLPALRKACRRLLRLSPEEKSNFDLDCVLLCLMEEKLGAIPLPIFYYQVCGLFVGTTYISSGVLQRKWVMP
jgi:hypothetical protein